MRRLSCFIFLFCTENSLQPVGAWASSRGRCDQWGIALPPQWGANTHSHSVSFLWSSPRSCQPSVTTSRQKDKRECPISTNISLYTKAAPCLSISQLINLFRQRCISRLVILLLFFKVNDSLPRNAWPHLWMHRSDFFVDTWSLGKFWWL